MFPSDWGERKVGSASKRQKTGNREEVKGLIQECGKAVQGYGKLEGGEVVGQAAGGGCLINCSGGMGPMGSDAKAEWEYPDNVVDVILRRVNDTRFAPAMPEELQLDHVLSGVPYKAMLESLFGGVSDCVPDVPLVTKAYEESFMREPGPGEQPCAMGELCECMFIDRNAPFVGVQFELPNGGSSGASGVGKGAEGASGDGNKGGRSKQGGASGRAQDTPKMCVLCYRKTTQKLFYDVCYSGKKVQGVIQHYGNLCNQPGEYARSCMLICQPSAQWQCMPLPMMSHQRNRYRVNVIAGVKHLQQLRVAFEDFAPPLDRMQD